MLLPIAFLAVAAIPQQKPAGPAQDKNLPAECTRHMRLIGRALTAFEQANGRLPDHLSDLYPKYLTDKKLLRCPADTNRPPEQSDEGREAVSSTYTYEMSGEPDGSGSMLLGPYPPGDKVTWRDVKTAQRRWFGDRVPAVRCGSHEDMVNLTLEGRIYSSGGQWETDPSTLPDVLASLKRDLAGDAKPFRKYWTPGSVADYFRRMREKEGAIPPSMRLKIRSAALLAQSIPSSGSKEKDGDVEFMAGNMLYAAQDVDKAIAAFEKAALSHDDHPKEAALGKLKQLFPETPRLDKPIRFYYELVQLYPNEPAFMRKLADWYEAAGQTAQAEQWRRRAGGG